MILVPPVFHFPVNNNIRLIFTLISITLIIILNCCYNFKLYMPYDLNKRLIATGKISFVQKACAKCGTSLYKFNNGSSILTIHYEYIC